MRLASSQRLNLSVGRATVAFVPATRAPRTRRWSSTTVGEETASPWTPKTSFFGAYGVSCRVRAERVKPYALISDAPQEPVRSQVGPPPPGAIREFGVYLALVVTSSDIYACRQKLSTLPSHVEFPSKTLLGSWVNRGNLPSSRRPCFNPRGSVMDYSR